MYNHNCYNRGKVFKILGFRTCKDLTEWLQYYLFIGSDDFPSTYLVNKNLMSFDIKRIKDKRGRFYKTVNIPLFTYDGVQYFKSLFVNPDLLEIELQNMNDHRAKAFHTKVL